jgi:hypothetical protein
MAVRKLSRLAPDPVSAMRHDCDIAACSNASPRTKVSVSRKRNFVGRDKGLESAQRVQGRQGRDEVYANNPATSALVVESREISLHIGIRGGAERTRSACQARSRYRTGLSRVIPRGNSAINVADLEQQYCPERTGIRAPLERYCPLISAPRAPRDPAPPAASPRWGFGGAARRRETEQRISMSKPAKKRPTASALATVPTTKSSRHSAGDPEPKRADRGSKQSRVIALLQSPTGQRSK